MVSAEALNILRRLELSPDISRGISRSEAAAAYSDLLQLDLELFPFSPFAQRVWALRDNLTCYDAWYVALAEALDWPLATLDQRLVRSSGPTCNFVTPSHPSPLPEGEGLEPAPAPGNPTPSSACRRAPSPLAHSSPRSAHYPSLPPPTVIPAQAESNPRPGPAEGPCHLPSTPATYPPFGHPPSPTTKWPANHRPSTLHRVQQRQIPSLPANRVASPGDPPRARHANISAYRLAFPSSTSAVTFPSTGVNLKACPLPARGNRQALHLRVPRDVEVGVPGVVCRSMTCSRPAERWPAPAASATGTPGTTPWLPRPRPLASSASTTRPGPWFAIFTTPSALAGNPYHPVRGMSAPHGGKDGGLNCSGSVGRRYTSVCATGVIMSRISRTIRVYKTCAESDLLLFITSSRILNLLTSGRFRNVECR